MMVFIILPLLCVFQCKHQAVVAAIFIPIISCDVRSQFLLFCQIIIINGVTIYSLLEVQAALLAAEKTPRDVC